MKQRYATIVTGAIVLSALGLAGCGAKTNAAASTSAQDTTAASSNTTNTSNTAGTGNTTGSTSVAEPTNSTSGGGSLAQNYVVNLHEVSNGTVWAFNSQTDVSNMPYTVYFSSYKTSQPSAKLKPSSSTKLAAIPPTMKENGKTMIVHFGNFYDGPQNWVLFTTAVGPKGATQSYVNYLYAVNPSTQAFEKVTSFKAGGGDHFAFAVKNNDVYMKATTSSTGSTSQTKYTKFDVQTKTSTSLSSKPSVTWKSLG